jgi:hypothetical protein
MHYRCSNHIISIPKAGVRDARSHHRRGAGRAVHGGRLGPAGGDRGRTRPRARRGRHLAAARSHAVPPRSRVPASGRAGAGAGVARGAAAVAGGRRGTGPAPAARRPGDARGHAVPPDDVRARAARDGRCSTPTADRPGPTGGSPCRDWSSPATRWPPPRRPSVAAWHSPCCRLSSCYGSPTSTAPTPVRWGRALTPGAPSASSPGSTTTSRWTRRSSGDGRGRTST